MQRDHQEDHHGDATCRWINLGCIFRFIPPHPFFLSFFLSFFHPFSFFFLSFSFFLFIFLSLLFVFLIRSASACRIRSRTTPGRGYMQRDHQEDHHGDATCRWINLGCIFRFIPPHPFFLSFFLSFFHSFIFFLLSFFSFFLSFFLIVCVSNTFCFCL